MCLQSLLNFKIGFVFLNSDLTLLQSSIQIFSGAIKFIHSVTLELNLYKCIRWEGELNRRKREHKVIKCATGISLKIVFNNLPLIIPAHVVHRHLKEDTIMIGNQTIFYVRNLVQTG